MKLTIDALKIHAEGCNKRFLTLSIEGKNEMFIKCIRIPNDLYKYLKYKGVPTSQKLRAERQKLLKKHEDTSNTENK